MDQNMLKEMFTKEIDMRVGKNKLLKAYIGFFF